MNEFDFCGRRSKFKATQTSCSCECDMSGTFISNLNTSGTNTHLDSRITLVKVTVASQNMLLACWSWCIKSAIRSQVKVMVNLETNVYNWNCIGWWRHTNARWDFSSQMKPLRLSSTPLLLTKCWNKNSLNGLVLKINFGKSLSTTIHFLVVPLNKQKEWSLSVNMYPYYWLTSTVPMGVERPETELNSLNSVSPSLLICQGHQPVLPPPPLWWILDLSLFSFSSHNVLIK